MPVKDPIELGEGQIYFNGSEEPIEVGECEIISADEDYAEDAKYISLKTEPFTFECSAAFPGNWTLVKCRKCDYKFPVTDFYAILFGTDSWTCPRCKFNELIEDARKRSKEC